MDDSKRPKQFAVSNNISKKKPKDYISEAIIIGAIIIAVALLVNISSFELQGLYLVGASPNATVQSNITNDFLNTNSKIVDKNNHEARVSVYNDLITGIRIPDVLVQFQYNVASNDVNLELTNGGTVSAEDSQAVLRSGTNATAKVHMLSVEAVRYKAGEEAYALFTANWVTGGVADSIQHAGLFSEEEGFFIGYNDIEFGVGFTKNSVDTFTSQSNFNLDCLCGNGTSGFILNQSSNNMYRITFGWLGSAPAVYEVYGGYELDWIPFHYIDFGNRQKTPSINNPVLNIHFDIEKTAGTTDIEMRTSSFNGGIVNGGIETASERDFALDTERSIASGVLTNIITLNNSETFFNKTNRVDALLQAISIATDGTKSVDIFIILNPTLDGTQVWQQVDVNNSVMFYDFTSTVITGGKHEYVINLAKVDSTSQIIKELNMHWHAGDILTIAAESSGNSDIGLSIRWEELF